MNIKRLVNGVQHGQIVKHYKGQFYEILHVADHTETREQMVVYKQLYTNNYPYGYVWCRPLSMFEEDVIYNNQVVKRFEHINKQEYYN
jgi:hypothetical protein